MGKDLPISPGDIILGKYRVERLLGKGGMGLVVAVRHLELDELFAMKLLLPDVLRSGEAVERFLREARAAAKLKGDHVAKVVDVGRLPDGAPYMVMEHLTGSDLKEVLKQRGALPPDEVLTYVLQACETLSEAHALGIVHRDVKPANLFLTRKRNGTPCIKVLDFGISKHTGNDAVALTATGTVGGSPLYMSPEQMRSAKHVDHRTDIWSIGILLYELLTGDTPFVADTITAVAGRVLTEAPVLPSQIRPSDIHPATAAALDAIVMRCLAKHPEGRFQTVDDLMGALDAARRGEALPSQERTLPLASHDLGLSPRDHLPSTTALLVSSRGSSTTTGFSQVATAGAPRAGSMRPAAIVATLGLVLVALVVLSISLLRPTVLPSTLGSMEAPPVQDPATSAPFSAQPLPALAPPSTADSGAPSVGGHSGAPSASGTESGSVSAARGSAPRHSASSSSDRPASASSKSPPAASPTAAPSTSESTAATSIPMSLPPKRPSIF